VCKPVTAARAVNIPGAVGEVGVITFLSHSTASCACSETYAVIHSSIATHILCPHMATFIIFGSDKPPSLLLLLLLLRSLEMLERDATASPMDICSSNNP